MIRDHLPHRFCCFEGLSPPKPLSARAFGSDSDGSRCVGTICFHIFARSFDGLYQGRAGPKSPVPRSSRQAVRPVSPSAATLIDYPASVANKRLTSRLGPFAATLTRRSGVPALITFRGRSSAFPQVRLPSVAALTPGCYDLVSYVTL